MSTDNLYLLEQRFAACLGRQVELILTDNQTSLASVRPGIAGTCVVRIHRAFVHADAAVIEALCAWLKNPKTPTRPIVQYVREWRNQELTEPILPVNTSNTVTVATPDADLPQRGIDGHYHNLQAIFNQQNQTYFCDQCVSKIIWARNSQRKNQRSIRLGSYWPLRKLIKIHPRLDSAEIPEYMVRMVVFHEMLHEYIGISQAADGTRVIHGEDFRRLEQKHPDYARAQIFEKNYKW